MACQKYKFYPHSVGGRRKSSKVSFQSEITKIGGKLLLKSCDTCHKQNPILLAILQEKLMN